MTVTKPMKQARRMMHNTGAADFGRASRAVESDGASSGHSGQGTEITSPHPGANQPGRLQKVDGHSRCRTHSALSDPVPIWFAVLLASGCYTMVNGCSHSVPWEWLGDRAVYTNTGAYAEVIDPLGVRVESGCTVAVFWPVGETGYSVETYAHSRACA
jgi:hypothetical protein